MTSLSSMRYILRGTVALQCLGHARWFLRLESTPIAPTPVLSFLVDPGDIGGLALAESTGLLTEQVIGWCLVAAAVLVLVRPCSPVLVPVMLLQVLIAWCMTRMDEGFSPHWTLPSHALRITAPLALVWIDPWRSRRSRRPPAEPALRAAEVLLRWAAALTFLGHGMDAWQLSPEFQNLISATAFRWLDVLPAQPQVEAALRTIAVVDILMAALVVLVRWRGVLWWMAAWGFVTSCSRVTAGGVLYQYHETLIRAAHAGVPLALALYWTLRCRTTPARTTPDKLE